jgi:hypothetical protein
LPSPSPSRGTSDNDAAAATLADDGGVMTIGSGWAEVGGAGGGAGAEERSDGRTVPTCGVIRRKVGSS